MTEEKALHIEQKIVAGPGATIRDVQQQVIIQRPPPGVPFQAPPLPDYFVPRLEVSATLKAHLLADAALAPGVLVVSAIHGLGGVGKSTLAAALAHDPEVQAHFPDGVLWATLGQQPDLLSLLSGWVQALGDYDFRPTTVEAASAHLRSLLHDKAALLVVDDAWDPAHPGPFRVGGARCRVVITTRETLIAQAVGATLYDLDVMTPAQAQALLAGRLRRDLAATERDQALVLAGAAGYLPLALELAAAQVADGLPWAELLADLQAEIARLESLDLAKGAAVADEASRKRLSLLASFDLSLRRLPAEKRRHFAWLGVLPEDASLTPAMAMTLWETDERTASETLRYLRGKALLLPGVSRPDGAPTYRLHDLLHDLARRLLTAPAEPGRADDLPGLGLTLAAAHAALLDRYRARAPNGLWHTLPNDGYIHPRLAWHMEQAARTDELHTLLREETAEGQNGWYQARDRLGKTAGYLADVTRAWRLAEEQFSNLQSPISIAHQCRYALISASFNSLASNIPPTLLAALVKEGVWTPTQGLAYARQVPDPDQRTNALTELAPYLLESLLQEAPAKLVPHPPKSLREGLAALAQVIGDEGIQAKVLIWLAPDLPEVLLREVLVAAQAIGEEAVRAKALGGLAPHLPETLLPEALAAARTIEDKKVRASALTWLAPYLPAAKRAEVVQEALVAAQMIGEEADLAAALDGLAPHLPETLLREALAAARTIKDEGWRARALVWLIPCLSVTEHTEVVREVWAAAQAIEWVPDRFVVLANLAAQLPETLSGEVLAAARAIEFEGWRAFALARLSPHLSEVLLQEAWKAAQAIEDERCRANALAGLAPHLPKALLQEARKAVWMIKEDVYRREALTGLALRLAELDDPQEALAAACSIDDSFRAEALARLAPHLPETLLEEVLAVARAIRWIPERAKALAGLAPHLPEALLGEALAAARMIKDERWRAMALAGLIPHLSEAERTEVVREALTAARAIRDEDDQAKLLAELAPHLPEVLLREALVAARAIADKGYRAKALAKLAPHLPEVERVEVVQEAMATARATEGEKYRAEELASLALYLPEVECAEVVREALATARAIWWETDRAEILAKLAPHLPEVERAEVVREALATAQAIEDEVSRRKALVELTPQLAELGYLQEARAAVQTIGPWGLAEALAGLAPHLPQVECIEVMQEVLVLARETEDEDMGKVLAGLAPHLPEALLREALTAARTIKYKVAQAEALAGLAPHLPQVECIEVMQEALVLAREIEHEWERVKALTALTPLLAGWPYQELYPLWQATLPILAGRTRSDLLSDLRALTPVIAALGGVEGVAETFRAIQDVGRWWP